MDDWSASALRLSRENASDPWPRLAKHSTQWPIGWEEVVDLLLARPTPMFPSILSQVCRFRSTEGSTMVTLEAPVLSDSETESTAAWNECFSLLKSTLVTLAWTSEESIS